MNRLFLLLFFASFSLFSHAINAIVNNIEYKINFEAKQVEIVRFRSSAASVVIPSSIFVRGKNYQVTSIQDRAFAGCKSLTSVVIPHSVTSIGYEAFSGCKSLTSIVIPNSVTIIEGRAFVYCDALTSVTLPISVTKFGARVFGDCTSLTSIKFPQGMTSIPRGTCSGCKSLTSVTIPNSVTSIEEWAFKDCVSLTSLTIPEKVSKLFSWAFEGCIALKTVTFLSPTPPKAWSNPKFCAKHATICVPAGAKKAYLTLGAEDYNEYTWVSQYFEYIREINK